MKSQAAAATLGRGTRVGRDARQEVGGAQMEEVGLDLLGELQVPQTASEPGAGGQAVLFDPHCKRDTRQQERQRSRGSLTFTYYILLYIFT